MRNSDFFINFKVMEPTEIITIESAKDWLSTKDETHLPRLIKSALDWVESYTGHSLYSKPVVEKMQCGHHLISHYPFVIMAVRDPQGNAVEYTYSNSVYDVCINAPAGSIIHGVKGYTNMFDIPSVLIDAAYKMLTYMYENRDVYASQAPTDVKNMVSKLRRNLV